MQSWGYMQNLPLISIIIPTYNSSMYIGKCLHSVVTQTYSNLEIIVINNNSTDKTKDICIEFASKDKRIIVTDELQRGVANARNKGLDIMHGDYFFFLDSDDYIKSNCIEALFNSLTSNDTKIALSNFFYDLNDKSITYYAESKVINGRDFLKDALCRKFNLNPCWGILYDTSTYGHLRFDDYKLCEDELYVIKQMAITDKISFIADTLLIYRDNKTSSITAGKSEVFLDGMKAQEQILDFITREIPDYKPYAICNYITLALFIYFRLKDSKCAKSITNPIVSKIKKYRRDVIKTEGASLNTREVCLLSYFGFDFTYRIFNLYRILQHANNEIVLESNTDSVKMDSILISVIVPVFNCEKYLNNCIKSIQNQKHSKLEIIIIDDGSNDSSPKICDELKKKDSRIKVIHQENAGLSAARNSGIKASTGDYIAFVDSDDYVHSEFLSTLLNDSFLYGSDVAICKFHKTSKNNGIIPDKIIELKDTSILTRELAIESLIESDSVNMIVAWNKLYRREIFDNILFPVGKYCEDNYVAYEVFAKANKVTYNEQPLYYYYQNLNSITHQRDDLSDYELEALDTYDNYIKTNFHDKSKRQDILDKSLLKRTNMIVEDYYAAHKLKHKDRMNMMEMHFEELKAEFNNRNLKLNHKLGLFDKSRKLFLLERRMIELVGNFKVRHNLYK